MMKANEAKKIVETLRAERVNAVMNKVEEAISYAANRGFYNTTTYSLDKLNNEERAMALAVLETNGYEWQPTTQGLEISWKNA